MPVDLPAGYAWRRATPADAEAIYALVSRCNTEVLGYADVTLNDIRDDLIEPGFDLETDSWLGFTPDGSLAGFAWAIGKGSGEQVDVDVITRDDQLASWLYDRVLARAAEIAHAGGHARYVVDKGIYRADTRASAAAEKHGFSPVTVFYRMRIDHGAVAVDPVPPQGLTVHNGPGDEGFRRTAHAVLNEAFKDHFGWAARTFEDWHQLLEQELTFDWSQLAVAELDSRPVAVLLTTDRYVEDENCGYVADIGVLAEARGRGIAKYLLRTAFAADIRAGRAGTILHVDSNNTTPALGLYESVGMRPVLVIDVWRRAVG
ncbi:MAG TPA: GNAT family N-acetyltransferase [Actinophytocola sp.]|uniref:GNAT family N-acetyltransferase n=1 Tax=Actinophytocola sp. TaxID=1872138 RepID=UPI002DDCD8B8|nr:GNAT family N-acetyltransferase [Actinophytocola sp.]HEV2784078.1 GNAT family N-acetyltransferase [Actinophytocola sp.]